MSVVFIKVLYYMYRNKRRGGLGYLYIVNGVLNIEVLFVKMIRGL